MPNAARTVKGPASRDRDRDDRNNVARQLCRNHEHHADTSRIATKIVRMTSVDDLHEDRRIVDDDGVTPAGKSFSVPAPSPGPHVRPRASWRRVPHRRSSSRHCCGPCRSCCRSPAAPDLHRVQCPRTRVTPAPAVGLDDDVRRTGSGVVSRPSVSTFDLVGLVARGWRLIQDAGRDLQVCARRAASTSLALMSWAASLSDRARLRMAYSRAPWKCHVADTLQAGERVLMCRSRSSTG